MQTTQTQNEMINISREKLLSLVSQTFSYTESGREDDEHPLPRGPWDPIIRKVSQKFSTPHPEPWRAEFTAIRIILEILAARHPEIFDVLGDGHLFSRAAAELNPQPLPPRAAFLSAFTQEIIERTLLVQEVAEALDQTGGERGIIIVSGRIDQFITDIDELCPRIPRRFPKPKGGSENRFSALELLTVSAVFQQSATIAFDQNVRNEFQKAGAKLAEMSLDRL